MRICLKRGNKILVCLLSLQASQRRSFQMDTTIFFSSYNASLGTRILGAQIRETIVKKMNSHDKVYLDFDGVEMVTNSFADECFRKLREENQDSFRNKITFVNANDFIQRVIISAL